MNPLARERRSRDTRPLPACRPSRIPRPAANNSKTIASVSLVRGEYAPRRHLSFLSNCKRERFRISIIFSPHFPTGDEPVIVVNPEWKDASGVLFRLISELYLATNSSLLRVNSDQGESRNMLTFSAKSPSRDEVATFLIANFADTPPLTLFALNQQGTVFRGEFEEWSAVGGPSPYSDSLTWSMYCDAKEMESMIFAKSCEILLNSGIAFNNSVRYETDKSPCRFLQSERIEKISIYLSNAITVLSELIFVGILLLYAWIKLCMAK